jgi:hypothetical protein
MTGTSACWRTTWTARRQKSSSCGAQHWRQQRCTCSRSADLVMGVISGAAWLAFADAQCLHTQQILYGFFVGGSNCLRGYVLVW